MEKMLIILEYVLNMGKRGLNTVLGGWDGLLYTLLFCMAVDYLTAALVSISKKRLSGKISLYGFAKKTAVFFLVAVGYVIDEQIIRNGYMIRTMIILFYISNEGISILENAEMLGLPIPQKLKRILKLLKD